MDYLIGSLLEKWIEQYKLGLIRQIAIHNLVSQNESIIIFGVSIYIFTLFVFINVSNFFFYTYFDFLTNQQTDRPRKVDIEAPCLDLKKIVQKCQDIQPLICWLYKIIAKKHAIPEWQSVGWLAALFIYDHLALSVGRSVGLSVPKIWMSNISTYNCKWILISPRWWWKEGEE